MGNPELSFRIKEHFKFTAQELGPLAAAIIIYALIFSSCDWGVVPGNCSGDLDLASGFWHFFITLLLVGFSIFFRLSAQKIYGLKVGLKAEIKVWWIGLAISLIIAMMSVSVSGKLVPLVFLGAMVTTFMVKNRLGEFRYGFSYFQNGMVGAFGVFANLLLALIGGIGFYYLPENYLFYQAMVFNLILAWCALIPLPQLDGLSIFFGSRTFYYILSITVLIFTLLILTQTAFGLILLSIVSIFFIAFKLLTSTR